MEVLQSQADASWADDFHSLVGKERVAQLRATMRAVVYDRFGSPEVLRLTSVRTPTPTSNQLLIRTHFVSVNPIDVRLRRGEFRWLLWNHRFPRMTGHDLSGEIMIAPTDSGFLPGDRVMAFTGNIIGDTCADYVVCPPHCAVKLPDAIDLVDAASLPLAGVTAIQCLLGIAKISDRQRVLINGASGGVGSLAVQVALSVGARVTAVASASREPFLRSLGVDHFIDYTSTDFLSSGNTWHVIFDVKGNRRFRDCRFALEPGGQFVSTEPSLKGIWAKVCTALSNRRCSVMLARPRQSDLRKLVELIKQNKLKCFLDSVHPVSEAAAAHQRLEQGVEKGKVIIGPFV